MRPIQFSLLSQWRPHVDEMNHFIQVDNFSIPHLFWWTEQENVLTGTSILTFKADLTLWTDASAYRWGAHLENLDVSGKWSVMKQSLHINLFELSTVENALHHFKDNVKHKQILLRTDNSTVVSTSIAREGQNHGGFYIGVAFGVYSFEQHTFLGKKNVIANQLSRGRQIPKMTECCLNRDVVKQIFRV